MEIKTKPCRKISKGYWDNIKTWLYDFEVKDRLFRVFFKDGDPDEECQYAYLTQWINVGNDILVGMQSPDDKYPDGKYPAIEYYLLSEIHLDYFVNDDN